MRIGFVAVAVAVSWFHLWRPAASFDVVAWGATIVSGYPCPSKVGIDEHFFREEDKASATS